MLAMGPVEVQTTLSLNDAAARLGVHYMTAYRYVRTGLLPAAKRGATWHIEEQDLRRFEQADDIRGAGPRTRAGYVERLADRLVVADELGASALVDQALAGGADVEEVYLQLVVPALRLIGERWEAGAISVAAEHQASAIVLRLLGRIGPRFLPRGARRGTVVLGAAPGDHHGLPSAILADVLRIRRFEVVDLGADTPAASFADACADRDRLVLVGVCATVKRDRAVRDVVKAVRGAGVDVPILAGGAGVTDEVHARALGADGWAASGGAAADAVEALVADPAYATA
jgi:excisionase family DNA binding protein